MLSTKRILPGAWRLLRAWERRELPSRAPPLPIEVALALAGFAASIGRRDVAALILLGYHGMMRTTEFLTLTSGNVWLDESYRGVVALEWSKMGQRRGMTEYVTIDDSSVGARLSAVMRKLPSDAPILQGPVVEFRKIFNDGMAALKLTDANYRPYSIRRGGASFDFVSFGDLQRTMSRGRWSSTRVARIYIVEGWQILNSLSLSRETRNLCEYFRSFL